MGHACTHSPHATHVDSPIGSSRSNTIFGVRAAQRETDDVVDLFLAARAHATRALDAGIEVHRHRRVRDIGGRLCPRGKAGTSDAQRLFPVFEFGVGAIEFFRNVGREQLDDHFLCMHGARTVARDLHAGRRDAAAGRRQHALALDFHHARAAIAVGPHARLVAKVRNVDAVAQRGLDDRLTGDRGDRLSVQLELDCRGASVHVSSSLSRNCSGSHSESDSSASARRRALRTSAVPAALNATPLENT